MYGKSIRKREPLLSKYMDYRPCLIRTNSETTKNHLISLSFLNWKIHSVFHCVCALLSSNRYATKVIL